MTQLANFGTYNVPTDSSSYPELKMEHCAVILAHSKWNKIGVGKLTIRRLPATATRRWIWEDYMDLLHVIQLSCVCCHSVNNLPSSHLIYKDIKTHKTISGPIIII